MKSNALRISEGSKEEFLKHVEMKEYIIEMIEDYQRKKQSITDLRRVTYNAVDRARLKGKSNICQMVIDDLKRVLKDSETATSDQS